MGVKLGIAGRKMGKQGAHIGFVHPRVLEQAENQAGVADAALLQKGTGPAREAEINGRVESAIRELALGQAKVQEKWIVG